MNDARKAVAAILVGILIVLGAITFFTSIRAVGTGEVGVVTAYGEVTGRELDEGLSFVAPLGMNSVTKYDVKNQKEEMESSAATKDLQDVRGTLVLNYQLLRGEVSSMHKEVGSEYKEKLIIPALNETFKAASAKYNAGELITKRAEVKNDVYTGLKDRLEPYGISVLDVSITEFGFSAEFNKAIEAVQIENQQVQRSKQQLERARVDAERKIAEAEGSAEAQRLQQETLTQQLLDKQWIEKWDGKLPQYTGDGANLYIPAGN